MMKFILSICFVVFLLPLSPALAAKLLIIDSQIAEPYKTVRESLLEELEKLGYDENKNLSVTHYNLGNFAGRAKNIWRKEKDSPYDVVFLNGTIAVTAFKELALGSADHKFLFGAVTDPVGIGVIDDFVNPPKSNFTGVSYPVRVQERFRFIKKVMPKAKTLGMIYAEMPQSWSYRNWVENMLKKDEFKDLKILFRKVEFVKSDGGSARMAKLAEKHVRELNAKVDAFVSPNDQMGAEAPFTKMVYRTATKPLIGLGRKDVVENWGATMAVFPSMTGAGKELAQMAKKVFEGTPIKEIIPKWPSTGVAFDLEKANHFKIEIPPELLVEAGENIIPLSE